MSRESNAGVVAILGRHTCGVFTNSAAARVGLDRKQLAALVTAGVVERRHPGVYIVLAVADCAEQRLRAALAWAGPGAAAAGRSAAAWYGLDGVREPVPAVAVAADRRLRTAGVVVHRVTDRRSLMVRRHRGLPVTGVEATLVALAAEVDAEGLEIAAEDARRRGLTSVPAMRAYLTRFGRSGRSGVAPLRRLLAVVDPVHPARSKLEVLTRRVLCDHGLADFAREHRLLDAGREYFYDFAFLGAGVILEVNGRRYHDDPTDYEHDHEKWSVPARNGFRLVFATWDKVTQRPDALIAEIQQALAA